MVNTLSRGYLAPLILQLALVVAMASAAARVHLDLSDEPVYTDGALHVYGGGLRIDASSLTPVASCNDLEAWIASHVGWFVATFDSTWLCFERAVYADSSWSPIGYERSCAQRSRGFVDAEQWWYPAPAIEHYASVGGAWLP